MPNATGRKRGPAKKKDGTGDKVGNNAGSAQDVAKPKAKARGPGRPKKTKTQEEGVPDEVMVGDAGTVPIAGPASREHEKLPDREPRPRENRNDHPGIKAGVAGPQRRTTEQVAADREAERVAMLAEVKRGEDARRRLAELQLQEEHDAHHQSERIHQKRLAPIQCGRKADNSNASEGESFDFAEVDAMSISSDEPETPKEKPSKEKPVKGAEHARMQKLVEEMRGSGKVGGSKKPVDDVRVRESGLSPKKYKSSGLRIDTGKKPEVHATDSNDGATDLETGGLDEVTIDDRAGRPTEVQNREKVQPPQRNPQRTNEVIAMKIVDDIAQAAATGSRPRKPKKALTQRQIVDIQQPDDTRDSDGQKIPDWAQARWPNEFINSLYHTLFISEEPFRDFRADSKEFLDTVKRVFDAVYPHIRHELTPEDIIVATSLRRVRSMKSKIAAAAIKEVETFFSKPPYANAPQLKKQYANWALSDDGPGIYGTPKPINCFARRGEPGYIAPNDMFMSRFIHPIVLRYMHNMQNSMLRPLISPENPPRGLLALVTVAVERAFVCYKAVGEYVKPPQFSYEAYGAELADYMVTINSLRPSIWTRILGRITQEERQDTQVPIHRKMLYIPESPVKRSSS